MKKIAYLLIIISFFSCREESSKTLSESDKFHSYSGTWTVPKDFIPIDEKVLTKKTSGTYTSVKIPGTDLVAGICPRYFMDDPTKKIIYYNIDIEMPTKNGNYVVSEQEIPIEYILSKNEIFNVKDIVSTQDHMITFNFGDNIFKFKLEVTKK